MQRGQCYMRVKRCNLRVWTGKDQIAHNSADLSCKEFYSGMICMICVVKKGDTANSV